MKAILLHVCMWALVCAGFFACEVVCASDIHKCRGADGRVSYQSAPCTAAQREEKSWAVELMADAPEDRTTRAAAERSIERNRAQVRARNARDAKNARPGGSVVHGQRNASACEAARAKRASTLQRAGLKRDFRLLRQLDDAVFAACQ